MLPVLLLLALEIGAPLPPLTGEFLTGKKATLPAAAQGKWALCALGFTYDSRFAVEAWVKRFRQDFDGKPNVTFYEVPMIDGMARMGKWFIDSGMRRGTPKAQHENVITVYGGADPWKKALGFKDPAHAYLILLAPDGTVRWQGHGPLDEAQYKQMAALIR